MANGRFPWRVALRLASPWRSAVVFTVMFASFPAIETTAASPVIFLTMLLYQKRGKRRSPAGKIAITDRRKRVVAVLLRARWRDRLINNKPNDHFFFPGYCCCMCVFVCCFRCFSLFAVSLDRDIAITVDHFLDSIFPSFLTAGIWRAFSISISVRFDFHWLLQLRRWVDVSERVHVLRNRSWTLKYRLCKDDASIDVGAVAVISGAVIVQSASWLAPDEDDWVMIGAATALPHCHWNPFATARRWIETFNCYWLKWKRVKIKAEPSGRVEGGGEGGS